MKGKSPKKWWNTTVASKFHEFNESHCDQRDDLTDLSQQGKSIFTSLKKELKKTVVDAKNQQFKKSLKKDKSIIEAFEDIRGLDGRSRLKEIREITCGDKLVTDDVEKASIFNNQFLQRVGNIKEKTKTKKIETDPSDFTPFTQHELRIQLRGMALEKNSPDGVQGILLNHLGPRMLNILLKIFNNSWKHSVVPSDWKDTHWIPVLKKGKPPNLPSSYRMISLTPFIAKLMERMVKERLTYFMQSPNEKKTDGIGFNQTSYRKTRSCRENILYVTDRLRFLKHQKKSAALVLLDIEKAFDSVNHDLLLQRMVDLGIPKHFIAWIQAFLKKRRAAVVVNNEKGSYHNVYSGVPQGTVLSALLFTLYIEKVAERLDITVAKYADDIAFVVDDEGKGFTYHLAKTKYFFNEIEKDLNELKLKVSYEPDKTKLVYYPYSPNSPLQTPFTFTSNLTKNIVPCVDSAKLLGVILDNKLDWKQHISYICRRVNLRLRYLKLVASKAWGQCTATLREVYDLYIRPVITNSCEAFYPEVRYKKIHMDRLLSLHLRGACYVLGALPPTRETRDKIFFEAQQQSINTHLRLETGRWFAKMARITSPLLNVFIPPERISSTPIDSFTRLGMNVLKEHNLLSLSFEKYPIYVHPPWSFSNDFNVFKPEMHVRKKKDKKKNKKACEAVLNEIRKDYEPVLEVYTDGAVVEERGAAGVYIIDSEGNEFLTNKSEAGIICTSFRAEMMAIKNAFVLLFKEFKPPENASVLFVSDSSSALMELEKGGTKQKTRLGSRIWQFIEFFNNKFKTKFIFQHVFSHCGIVGNEEADKLAQNISLKKDEETLLKQKKVPIDYSTHVAKLKHRIKEKFDPRPFPSETERAEEILISQLRIGDCKQTQGKCPRCREKDSVEHLLAKCSKYRKERRMYLQKDSLTQEELKDCLSTIQGLENVFLFMSSARRYVFPEKEKKKENLSQETKKENEENVILQPTLFNTVIQNSQLT